MNELPVMLNLTGKHVVIVGGGRIAERKMKGLLGSGATITVVSPVINDEIRRLANQHSLILIEREVMVDDLSKAFLIITSTNSSEVNDFVVKHAGEQQLVNAAHDNGSGNVSFPANFRQGRLTISVSTGGASPLLAKEIRDELALTYDDTYREYVERLYQLRVEIKKMDLNESERKKILENELKRNF